MEGKTVATEIVPGRCIKVLLSGGIGGTAVKQTSLYNLHVHDWFHLTVAAFVRDFGRDARRDKEDPCSHFTLLLGDLNIAPPEFKNQLVHAPAGTASPSRATAPAGSAAVLRALQAEATELTQQAPTHYDAKSSTSTCLDRCFTTLPPWALQACDIGMAVQGDPRSLSISSVSDHAPLMVSISAARPVPGAQRPIPHHIAYHPRFAEVATIIASVARLEIMDTHDRLDMHKTVLK